MAQQPMQAPPPAKGMTPQQYYMTLISQGMRSQDAYAALQQAYGPPKSPQQLQQEQQSAQSNAALAQTGGQLAGLAGAGYLYSQLGGTAATAGGEAVLGSTLAGGAGASGSMATAGGGAVMGSGAVGTGTAAGATGGVATGGGGAGGAAAGTGAGAVLVPAAIIAAAAATASNAWETGMKDIVRGRGTREDYINQGINMYGGPIPNMAFRLFGGKSIGARLTSGKSEQQQIRDSFRANLKDTGVADNKYQVSLADGSKFDIGLDGKHKFTNVDGKTQRNPYDVDFSNPLAKYATDKLDPMIRRVYEGAPESTHVEQFTGMLVNAAASNAKSEKDVDANIAAMLGNSPFAKQAGIDAKNVQALTKLERPNKGEVLRLSPGLYRTDTGKIQQAKTMRQALELAYAANPQQPIAQPQQPEEIPEL